MRVQCMSIACFLALGLNGCGPAAEEDPIKDDTGSPSGPVDTGPPVEDSAAPDPLDVDDDGDGYTENQGDCDDADASIGPEGIDGLIADRDCDGLAAEGTLELAEYAFIGESPEDYAGYWLSTAGDVDGDGRSDILVGAYNDDDIGPNSGAGYLILASSLDAHGTFDLSVADYKFVGEAAGDWAGFVVETAGDIDGDGRADLMFGAYGDATNGAISGAVYVVLASSLDTMGTFSLADADYKILGESERDYAGYALSSAGDVDGDGLDDLLVGASGHESGGRFAGAAYVILASSLASDPPTDLSQADYKFVGESTENWAGYSVSTAGDVDGDGLADLLVGADGDEGGWQAHASYLILGGSLGSTSTLDLSQADYKFIGESSYDYASQVSTAGDVDGDGLDDIIIGAGGRDEGATNAGAAYVILGSSLTEPGTVDLAVADYVLLGERSGDSAGSTVSDAGDVDGDGLSDIMVGAWQHRSDYDREGAAYVVLASTLLENALLNLADADYKLSGYDTGQYVGHSVSSAGDVDGDGLADVMTGAWYGPTWNGAAYLVTTR